MIPKVERMTKLAKSGYRLLGVDSLIRGGVKVCLAKGHHRVELEFEHHEVPAVLHATQDLSYAS